MLELPEETKATPPREETRQEINPDIRALLDESLQAIQRIKPAHLSEIKAFHNPPVLLKEVLTAVLLVFGSKDLTWDAVKKLLGDKTLLKRLVSADPASIPLKSLKALETLTSKPEFTPPNVRKVSMAAESV